MSNESLYERKMIFSEQKHEFANVVVDELSPKNTPKKVEKSNKGIMPENIEHLPQQYSGSNGGISEENFWQRSA